jgi:uncharacterized protein involved in exopolysaccharide biosynthesis/Mrp family chromosome partitioning ATPase
MSFQGINPKAAPPDAPPGASTLSFADVLGALRARLSLIVRVAALVIAVATVVALMLPTRYTSSAVIMLDPRKNTVADISAVLSSLPTDPSSIQNQIQILQSRDLAAEVIAKLNLYNDPEFNGALAPAGLMAKLMHPRNWFGSDAPAPVDPAVQRDAIIDAFSTHLWAESIGLSTTISVTFASADPDKAALIANTVAQTYVDDLVEAKLKASDATSAWLTQRIRELGNRVQSQEAAALTYRAQHNLDSSTGGTALMEAQLGGINGQIVQARADLSAKTAVYNQVQTLLKQGNPADISQIVASPLIIQLRTQQADLVKQAAAMAVTYGPKHPKRIAVDSQVHDLQQKIDEEGARIGSALANDVAVARAQLGSLQGSLNATQHQVSGQDLTAVRLRAIEADADSSRKLYESFLGRLTAIQDQEGLQYPDAHVISTAPVPGAPASPQRLLIVLASIPAGLLLGCLAALLAFRFGAMNRRAPVAAVAPRPRPRPAPVRPAPVPVAAYSGPPLLAEIPGALTEGAADHVIDWPASPFSRAVNALLARVEPNQPSATARIVSVTTSQGGRPGMTVALALARAAARSGLKTVIVDGHLSRPVLGDVAGVRLQGSLLDVLSAKTTINRALTRDPRSAALILGGTQPARDPQAVLASPRMGELFSHLRGICDFVVIAAPAVLASAEAPGFARLSDAVVMVARPEEGPQPPLRQAIQTLGQLQSAPVGMVVVH